MAVKYYCRKCGKKYVEWGAEKLQFLCPQCDGEELARVGGSSGPPKKPSLKRASRKARAKPPREVKEPADLVEPQDVESPDELLPGDDEDLEINADAPFDDEEN